MYPSTNNLHKFVSLDTHLTLIDGAAPFSLLYPLLTTEPFLIFFKTSHIIGEQIFSRKSSYMSTASRNLRWKLVSVPKASFNSSVFKSTVLAVVLSYAAVVVAPVQG